MNVFDLVVLLLIANAVQNAMVGADTNLLGGFLAALVLLIVNGMVARMRLKWPRLRRMVEGTLTLLVLNGEMIQDHMRQEGLDEETLLAAFREHGNAELRNVDMAVLEIDGTINVVPTGGSTQRGKKALISLRRQ